MTLCAILQLTKTALINMAHKFEWHTKYEMFSVVITETKIGVQVPAKIAHAPQVTC